MDENNSLDQLITEPHTDAQSPVNRPRLKKIKRPKIRPTNDLPSAPDKVFTEENSVSQSASSNLSSDSEDIVNREETAKDLIAPRDISEILQERSNPNPYVLDSLPPDFTNDEMDEQDDYDDFPIAEEKWSRRRLFVFALAFFLVGILFQAIFFSSSSEEKYGLEGVILNQDVPAGRPRCGLTEKTQACVFYLMNCYAQELTGRDFYKLAAQLTQREDYNIEMANLHYATVKIKPGHFAQINIPPLEE